MKVGISAEGSGNLSPIPCRAGSRRDRQGSSVATITDARGACEKQLGGVAGASFTVGGRTCERAN
jgi:hypothetical protein